MNTDVEVCAPPIPIFDSVHAAVGPVGASLLALAVLLAAVSVLMGRRGCWHCRDAARWVAGGLAAVGMLVLVFGPAWTRTC